MYIQARVYSEINNFLITQINRESLSCKITLLVTFALFFQLFSPYYLCHFLLENIMERVTSSNYVCVLILCRPMQHLTTFQEKMHTCQIQPCLLR